MFSPIHSRIQITLSFQHLIMHQKISYEEKTCLIIEREIYEICGLVFNNEDEYPEKKLKTKLYVKLYRGLVIRLRYCYSGLTSVYNTVRVAIANLVSPTHNVDPF